MIILRQLVQALIGVPDVFGVVWAELGDLRLDGPHARQATITALSVTFSVVIALIGHMDMPWWAAISGFMSVQATRPGSVQRATLRVLGTVAGATIALVIAPWVVNDHVGGTLCLLVIATIGMIGFLVSPHGYAWLFFAITLNLVVLLSIGDPTLTLHYAFYRSLEVTSGSLSALIVVSLLGSDAASPQPAALPPGWGGLMNAQWPVVLHAVRTGITIALLPWIWKLFDLPALSQMATTVAAIMAIPVLSDHALNNGRAVVERVVQRCLGCLLGGIAALLVLSLSINEFVPWIIILATGVWIGAYLQASTRGISYIGIQATVVWMMMLVQSWGPPDSLLPGINRFAGMTVGIVVLLLVSLLLWPEPEEDAGHPER
jgi:uncharacterized membrane protein YccC